MNKFQVDFSFYNAKEGMVQKTISVYAYDEMLAKMFVLNQVGLSFAMSCGCGFVVNKDLKITGVRLLETDCIVA